MTYQQFLTEIQLQIHSLFDTDVTIQLHKIQKIMALLWMDSLFCKRAATFLPLFISMIITKNIRQEKHT